MHAQLPILGFFTKTLPNVRTEMSLHVLAYYRKRMIKIMGVQSMVTAMAGYEIQQVALVTGHKDWRHLRGYANLKPEDLHRDAVRNAKEPSEML